MAAYMIAFMDVKDPEQYAKYTKHTPRVIAEFGGRMIVRGGDPAVVEGKALAPRCVIIEFPDRTTADKFYNSPQYVELRTVRADAATAYITIVDALPPALWDGMLAESRKHG